jgi:hypothetical protein
MSIPPARALDRHQTLGGPVYDPSKGRLRSTDQNKLAHKQHQPRTTATLTVLR